MSEVRAFYPPAGFYHLYFTYFVVRAIASHVYYCCSTTTHVVLQLPSTARLVCTLLEGIAVSQTSLDRIRTMRLHLSVAFGAWRAAPPSNHLRICGTSR